VARRRFDHVRFLGIGRNTGSVVESPRFLTGPGGKSDVLVGRTPAKGSRSTWLGSPRRSFRTASSRRLVQADLERLAVPFRRGLVRARPVCHRCDRLRRRGICSRAFAAACRNTSPVRGSAGPANDPPPANSPSICSTRPPLARTWWPGAAPGCDRGILRAKPFVPASASSIRLGLRFAGPTRTGQPHTCSRRAAGAVRAAAVLVRQQARRSTVSSGPERNAAR